MKENHLYRLSFLVTMISLGFFLPGCSKTSSGPSITTLVYVNDTYTPVSITANGITSTIPVGGSINYTATAGSSNAVTAQTSGLTSTNTVVGSVMNWTLNDVFPSSGTIRRTIDVPSQYFFLKIVNNSSYRASGLYVNYGLVSQTFDNINFGSGTYNIGYYQAYSNSNARCASSNGGYWQMNASLANSQNQSFTFSLTN